MKKAVNLVIAFLKKKKDDLSPSKDSAKETCSEGVLDPKKANDGERFSVIRVCKRCVLVYENKTREECVLRTHLQQCYIATEPNDTGIYPQENNAIVARPAVLLRGKPFQGFDINDQTSRSMTSLYEHLLQWSSSNCGENLGFHRPVFIWLRICEKREEIPLIYEDNDFALINLRLDLVFSFLNVQFPVCHLAERVEAWVLSKTFPKAVITLEMETELIHGFLQDLFDVAFLHLPFTSEERYAKLEAIFQAVDNILEISAHMIMASGDSPESESTVKEVIIETATVVTSTAAESTATVGIETAAMALGQAAAGIAISVLVDVALTAGSVTRAKLQRDKGLISHKQFKSEVKKKLCDSGCQFIGGTTGTIVGQVLIPVPVVGAIVGGFCGSLIGVGVSKGIMKTSELIARAHNSRAIKAAAEK